VGLLAAAISVISFLLLAHVVGGYNPALAGVVRADWIALALLALGGISFGIGELRDR
jgi:hypothetical protein